MLIKINVLSIVDHIDKRKNKIRRNVRRLTNERIVVNKSIVVNKLLIKTRIFEKIVFFDIKSRSRRNSKYEKIQN